MRPPAALPRRARSSERIAPDASPRRTVSYRRPGLPPLDASSRIAETHGLELISRRHRSRVRFPVPLLRTHYPGRRLCGFAWGTPSRHAASKACCLEGAVPDASSHRAALRMPFRIPCPLRRRLSAGKNLTFLYLRGRFLRLMARKAASCMEKPSLQMQESQFLANSASKCPRRATGLPISCQSH